MSVRVLVQATSQIIRCRAQSDTASQTNLVAEVVVVREQVNEELLDDRRSLAFVISHHGNSGENSLS